MGKRIVWKERDLQDAVMVWLQQVFRRGRWAAVQPRGNFVRGRPTERLRPSDALSYGVPDILGVLYGRAVGIELKRPDGRLRETQSVFHADWRAAGGIVLVCKSLEDVIEGVRELDRELRDGRGQWTGRPPSKPEPIRLG